jgi:formyltetrahydrofolate-dependent phosphoribosylglycinamide formyltransferase
MARPDQPDDPPSPLSPLAELVAWRARQRAAGRRVVLTNGCFDLLHAGHVRYLAQARALGERLVVALNSDESVAALKGPGRPVNPAADRAEVLCALRSVDRVVAFDGLRATAVIEALAPDIYAKGGDYTEASLNPGEAAALHACGAAIRILPLVPGRSTSATLGRLRGGGPRKPRLGILGSGSGSNFQAILDAIAAGRLDAEVALVASDNPQGFILERARRAGIPAVHVDPGPFRTKLGEAAQKEIRDRMVAAGVDLILLAGFMRIVKEPLLASFPRRILNIHPSLLPAFPGLAAWEQALAAGVAETGCTVHFVDAGMDTGEIIGQERVPVLPGDNAASLHARIQEAEHRLYPACVAQVAAGLGRAAS